MVKNNYITWLIPLILLLQAGPVVAQDEPDFPVPSGITNQLFYLQRTPNANTVIYEANFKDGELDSINPVHVFWLRYGDKGQREELSAIQRKYAYGIVTTRISPEHYEFRFLANKKRSLYLEKWTDDKYHVFVEINQKRIVIAKVFLKINGGPVFSPNIEYVEFTGLDAATGLPVEERAKI